MTFRKLSIEFYERGLKPATTGRPERFSMHVVAGFSPRDRIRAFNTHDRTNPLEVFTLV